MLGSHRGHETASARKGSPAMSELPVADAPPLPCAMQVFPALSAAALPRIQGAEEAFHRSGPGVIRHLGRTHPATPAARLPDRIRHDPRRDQERGPHIRIVLRLTRPGWLAENAGSWVMDGLGSRGNPEVDLLDPAPRSRSTRHELRPAYGHREYVLAVERRAQPG
jgi:hypothetical protein